ncbi:hypothetical protein JBL43_15530 [Aureibaculum sp. A20]|uniref:OmpH family outer membrane protein n=1 Tax=Aureibaculum flavum TaxID=2795986 RepID=A0ABS0WUK7_9FLAO|nr:hypothetical protein [Aureibaculum flavum]MBJ2175663.1 hypothetical protein [Aureibaculum flavum]
MKTCVANLFILIMLIGIICTSCGTAKTKTVHRSKKNTKTANMDLNKNAKNAIKDIDITENEEWKKINSDSQKKILEIENQIEALRGKIANHDKKDQKKKIKTLDSLEEKKNILKSRLVKINKRIKSNIEDINRTQEVVTIAFEKDFVQDLNELLKGLRDFLKN